MYWLKWLEWMCDKLRMVSVKFMGICLKYVTVWIIYCNSLNVLKNVPNVLGKWMSWQLKENVLRKQMSNVLRMFKLKANVLVKRNNTNQTPELTMDEEWIFPKFSVYKPSYRIVRLRYCWPEDNPYCYQYLRIACFEFLSGILTALDCWWSIRGFGACLPVGCHVWHETFVGVYRSRRRLMYAKE